MPQTKRLATALVLTIAMTLGTTASADAAKLKRGIYDCYAYDYYSGFLLFKGAVKFVDGGKYQHSWGREGKKLDKPTKGTYKVDGRKIKFKTGTMKHTPGRIGKRDASHKRPWFQVLSDGEPSGIDCTYVPKP